MIKEEKESQNWMTLSAMATSSRSSFYEPILRILLVSARQLELLIELRTLSMKKKHGLFRNSFSQTIMDYILISEVSELGFGSSQLKHDGLYPDFSGIWIKFDPVSQMDTPSFQRSVEAPVYLPTIEEKLYKKTPHVVSRLSSFGIARNVL
ncbi:hypothetical protein CEXT_261511 [Caerostris extrusa]|uniref:Maturase K n=1 Tax=Caerostris extrusa TaxID=172846 RepID=A0AAV4SS15_CAEEX|nr:hypothetical protein CEXT_261511 [Caerostris extrusa]